MTWKVRDPLLRGDAVDEVALPNPTATASLVDHILYLGGRGRQTRYLSLTEALPTAEHFAGDGAVWETTVSRLAASGAAHRSRKELLGLLKPPGKGPATKHTAYELMLAKGYVERWSEHLADFGPVPLDQLPSAVKAAFHRRPRR